MSSSLLTVAEYRGMPGALTSTNALVPDGLQPVQDAALAQIIGQASDWCASQADQQLVAATVTEQHRVRVARDGSLSIHPNCAPPNQLISVSVGTTASDLAAVSNLSGAFIDEEQWIVPDVGYCWGTRVLARMSSVGGWPNTILTVAATAAASTITVADASGMTPAVGSIVGATVTIGDGANTETVTVASVAGKVATLAAPLAYSHAGGVPVTGLPGDVKRAALLAVNGFLRQAGSDVLIVANLPQPTTAIGTDPSAMRDFGGARKILIDNYSRNR